MMLRLADEVRITVTGRDGVIERSDQPPLYLPGEGARLQTLAVLLGTPRPRPWLQEALARAHPQSAGGDLIGRLLDEAVLCPWELGQRLAELNQLTRARSDWPLVGPAAETARLLRENGGEAAVALPCAERPAATLAEALAWRRSVRQFAGDGPLPVGQLATLLALGAGLQAEVSALVSGSGQVRPRPGRAQLAPARDAFKQADARLRELQEFDRRLRGLDTGQRPVTPPPDADAPWLKQKIAEVTGGPSYNRGWLPVIDYGVRVNIEPLKVAKVLPRAADRIE
jgi:hypothetical protein